MLVAGAADMSSQAAVTAMHRSGSAPSAGILAGQLGHATDACRRRLRLTARTDLAFRLCRVRRRRKAEDRDDTSGKGDRGCPNTDAFGRCHGRPESPRFDVPV